MSREDASHIPANAPPALRPAPLRLRFAALFYDALLVVALLFLVTALALGISAADGGEPGLALRESRLGRFLFQLALLATALLYFAGFWRLAGQTPGMRAWGIRLQTLEGERPGMGRGLLRCLAASLSLACLGLGYWVAWVDAERCCWHDRRSGTRMMRLPSRRRQARRKSQAPNPNSSTGGSRATPNGDRE